MTAQHFAQARCGAGISLRSVNDRSPDPGLRESARQRGGFTPPSLAQMIVNVIEPDHGVLLDPARGSGGMFVQTSHFIEQEGLETMKRVTFYEHTKNETTARLTKMNLAVHGLEGNIRAGGATREALTKDVVSNIVLPISAAYLMDQLEELAGHRTDQIQLLASQNQKLAQARGLLLLRLMSEEIAV
jgi:hypothetical protein